LKDKVNQVIANLNKEVFSIAFFGAFSDGKSTILSVLTNRLDIDISPEPTTDKINTYQFGNYQIIDTPGLFSEHLTHDELTKKYISEANIIIYTVDPVNPLKDSHKATVKWILSELKKSESTIFVINKMDEIADLEDDEDFAHHSEIKKEVVANTIKDITGHEISKIVCIAADPFELGLKHWHDQADDYKKFSRIQTLENLISEFQTGYKEELIVSAGKSVICDAANHLVKQLGEIQGNFEKQGSVLDNQVKEYELRCDVLNKDINRSYINIKEEFISLREDILVELDAVADMSQLADVMQRRLGEEGYLLEEKINLIIEKYTTHLLSESQKLFVSLEESLVYHSNIQTELLGKLSGASSFAMKGMLSASTRTVADAVLKTRTFLKVPFKFKPWGAVKFAKFLKAMPVVMEVLQGIFGVWSKLKIDNKRKDVKEEIGKVFQVLIQGFTLENYKNEYFPILTETQNILSNLKKNKQETIAKIALITNELDKNIRGLCQ
jgi:small GTP-binding protein